MKSGIPYAAGTSVKTAIISERSRPLVFRSGISTEWAISTTLSLERGTRSTWVARIGRHGEQPPSEGAAAVVALLRLAVAAGTRTIAA